MPEIANAQAFYQPGVAEIVRINTITDSTGLQPTAAEINGGLKLLNEVFDLAGWSSNTNFIERRRAKSRTRTQVAGAITLEGSSITFTADKLGNDAAAEFAVGQTFYLAFADRGLVSGRPGEVFQVEVGAVVNLRNFDNDYFKIRVDFGIQRVEKITLPAGL
ncbi:hypothetical protein [Blastococcus sp. TF02A-26]|uniref:phage tail tube protein n=1 Tax=Blastococcus sp. TF02A-26 TaxID=2250577 RepID=UPI000DE9D56E|nr:hypothetical protein [Blastococcus sp. TF02A-26]RBY82680.1 hypothetical protein DQ240_18475 [Blastococcus sp. TF02A-26]